MRPNDKPLSPALGRGPSRRKGWLDMEKHRGQFGILAVLILTLVIGAGLAVARLPGDVHWKVFAIIMFALYFTKWACGENERLSFVVRVTIVRVSVLLTAAFCLWQRIARGGPFAWQADWLLIAIILFFVASVIWYPVILRGIAKWQPKTQPEIRNPFEDAGAHFDKWG